MCACVCTCSALLMVLPCEILYFLYYCQWLSFGGWKFFLDLGSFSCVSAVLEFSGFAALEVTYCLGCCWLYFHAYV